MYIILLFINWVLNVVFFLWVKGYLISWSSFVGFNVMVYCLVLGFEVYDKYI